MVPRDDSKKRLVLASINLPIPKITHYHISFDTRLLIRVYLENALYKPTSLQTLLNSQLIKSGNFFLESV
jgi:hypothetical protein